MAATSLRLVPVVGWRARLRRLVRPPRTYTRCNGCHKTVIRRCRRAPEGKHYQSGPLGWDVCGAWQAIPASWASAARARLR